MEPAVSPTESIIQAPVDLPALPRSGIPPWLVEGDGITPGIAWSRAAHPERVVDVSEEARTPAGLLATGRLTRQGVRVVAWLPAAMEISAYRAVLEELGRRQEPLILIASPVQVAMLLVPGWFAAAGSDPRENAAIFASSLAHEWPTLIGAGAGGTPWPGGAYEPGRGRWLRSGEGAFRVVTAIDAAVALATPGPVWQRTSLAPAAPPPG